MIKRFFFQLIFAVLFISSCFGQDTSSEVSDTTIIYKNQAFTLADVIVRNNLDVGAFIDYVKNDTTFYKAFRNLRVLNFSSYNDILINDKKGNLQASLHSTTTQVRANGCRTMVTNEEHTTPATFTTKAEITFIRRQLCTQACSLQKAGSAAKQIL